MEEEAGISGRVRCPSCGAQEGLPILYGMPAPDSWYDAPAGFLVVVIDGQHWALGGCQPEETTARCQACGHSWVHRFDPTRTGGSGGGRGTEPGGLSQGS